MLESELEILFDDHINILSKQSKMVIILVWMLSYSKWFDVMGGVKTLSDWELRERIIDFRVDDLILIYILMGSGKKTLVNAFYFIW